MTISVNFLQNNILSNRLSPILKWAGGKEQELKYIHPAIPRKFKNYYEPFIGGGAVYFSLNAEKSFINDKSHELINLYLAIKYQDDTLFNTVQMLISDWVLIEKIIANNSTKFINFYLNYSTDANNQNIKSWIFEFTSKNHNQIHKIFNIDIENFIAEIHKNFINKIIRMKKIEKEKGKLPNSDIIDNIESSFKSAYYMYIRHLYNNLKKYNINKSIETAIFFFIRNFAYSGMFRYNKNGDFNVPYGGIGYNRKNLTKKLDYLKSTELINHLSNTSIDNLDFEDFFIKNKPSKDDFIFLDPPYDSEFSTYAQNEFTKSDQARLANYLINKCEANWMMIIKNTDFIHKLYDMPNIYIDNFDKKYMVSFQNRNNKDTEHLLIKNYE